MNQQGISLFPPIQSAVSSATIVTFSRSLTPGLLCILKSFLEHAKKGTFSWAIMQSLCRNKFKCAHSWFSRNKKSELGREVGSRKAFVIDFGKDPVPRSHRPLQQVDKDLVLCAASEVLDSWEGSDFKASLSCKMCSVVLGQSLWVGSRLNVLLMEEVG